MNCNKCDEYYIFYIIKYMHFLYYKIVHLLHICTFYNNIKKYMCKIYTYVTT